jgi:ubiquinone/menaquinone biosynthesis C-methylase UbiE
MSHSDYWRKFWDARGEKAISDYEVDHGHGPGDEIQALSEQELLRFIDPQPDETIFDAGCGTGGNIVLLSPRVKEIIGMDYSRGATERCQRRIDSSQLGNAKVVQGNVTKVPLPDGSVDKVLCVSLLQYMDDSEVACALSELKRILHHEGVIILHVKNLSSLYLASLWAVKRVKMLLKKQTKLEFYRSFSWYVKTLRACGFEIVDYNSFSLLMFDGMPNRLLLLLQRLELQNCNNPFFRLGFLRRHGSELKIKARLKQRV